MGSRLSDFLDAIAVHWSGKMLPRLSKAQEFDFIATVMNGEWPP
jgi:hypothetical protein